LDKEYRNKEQRQNIEEMSFDKNTGEKIKNSFERAGFKVRNTPLEGESFHLVLQTMKNEDMDTMEILQTKNSDIIVFTGTVYLSKGHHEKYRNFDDDKRKRFDEKLDELLKSMTDNYEVTEDERGFGVLIHDQIHVTELNTESLQERYSNVNEPVVKVWNFFMDAFWDKIEI